jgi:photosystem II stability/assembly factor-like uncharacterized protein
MKKNYTPLLGAALVAILAFVGKGLQAQNIWKPILANSNFSTFTELNNGQDGYFYCVQNDEFITRSNNDQTFNMVKNYNLTGISTTNFRGTGKAGYIFVASEGEGFRVSTDGGQTFKRKNKGLGGDTNLVNVFLMPNGNIIVENRGPNNAYQNIYLSKDNGENWTLVKDIGYSLFRMSVAPNNDVYLIGYVVHKSSDNGETWTKIDNSFAFGTDFVFDANGGIYRVGNSAKGETPLMVTTNNGTTWNPITPTSRPKGDIGQMFKTPNDTIYASTVDSIFFSPDFGKNWIPYMSGIPKGNFSDMCMTKDGYLFSGFYTLGLYRTNKKIYTPKPQGIQAYNASILPLTMFPNPSRGIVQLQLPEEMKHSTLHIEVFTISGQKVYEENRAVGSSPVQLDFSALAKGMYTLQINTQDKLASGQLSIE